MKIVEVKEVSKNKIGRIALGDAHLEAYEYETSLFLAKFGFDIEVLKPTNTPKSNNPDILMLGTIWEIKTLESSNRKTIKKRVHKASLQSNHIVFDLRKINKNCVNDVKNDIVRRFTNKRTLKRMIMITADNTIDIQK